jgi:signal transduction histidine kinase
MDFQSDKVWLTISDNGRGFDPATAHSGLGLQSMKERVQAVGGGIKLNSLPSEGTKVIIDVPYNGQENEL